jgi:hypothetical protein
MRIILLVFVRAQICALLMVRLALLTLSPSSRFPSSSVAEKEADLGIVAKNLES